jgi:hypothetical protein
MAKLKAARPKAKTGPQPGAISCILLLVIGMGLLSLLFFLVLKSGQ